MILLLLAIPNGRASTPLKACEDWAQRKTGACRQEVNDATMAPSSAGAPQTLLTPYTLYQQCNLFPERRTALAKCAEAQSCTQFASCTMALTAVNWDPRMSPALCDAFLARKNGSAAKDISRTVRGNTPDETFSIKSNLYGLYSACSTNDNTRAALNACMMKDDPAFASCVLDLIISSG